MRYSKSPLIAVLVGVSIAGIAGASAATLGGLNSDTVGSDNDIVAACDTDGITVDYTTSYSAADQEYKVTAVVFGGVNAACNGLAASVSLRDDVLELATKSSASITVAADSFTLTLDTPVVAEDVDGVSLIISG